MNRTLENTSHRSRIESFYFTVIWFLLLSRISWPDGLNSTIGNLGIPSNSNSTQIANSFGLGDAGNLLGVATTWSKFEGLSVVDQHWIVRLWSPGLPVLEVPMLWLERLGVPIFWSFSILLTLLWSIGFYLIWRYISPHVGRISILVLATLMLLSWDFKYMFHDGIFYTEGYSYFFLLYSLFSLSYQFLNPNIEKKNQLIFLSGVSLGISIWIRHTLDAYIFIIGLLGFVMWVLNIRETKNSRKAHNFRLKKKRRKISTSHSTLVNYALVAFLVTLPWRFIATFHFGGSPFLMSSGGSLFGPYIWADPKSDVGKYWDSYGSNWACKIDSITCTSLQNDLNGSISPNMLILKGFVAAIQNPIDYVTLRWSYAYQNWIPGFGDSFNIQNIVALFSFASMMSIFILVAVRRNREDKFLLMIWLPLIIIQLFYFLVIHFESRYFISLRLTSACLLLLVLGRHCSQRLKIFNFS
jgi:hypothetical protein